MLVYDKSGRDRGHWYRITSAHETGREIRALHACDARDAYTTKKGGE